MSRQVRCLPTPSSYAYAPGFALQVSKDAPTLEIEDYLQMSIGRKKTTYIPRYLVEIRDIAGRLIAYDYSNKGVYAVNDDLFFAADLRALNYGSYKILWRTEGVSNRGEPWDFQHLEIMTRVAADHAFKKDRRICEVAGLNNLPTADQGLLLPADGRSCKAVNVLCASLIPGPPGANAANPEFRVNGGMLQWRLEGASAWQDLVNIGSLVTSVGWDDVTGKPAGLCTAEVGAEGLYLEFRNTDGDLIGKSLYENS